ncbi:60S ribosomal protein L29 [Anaeramoeba flamelloides]|uniref:60S ribosomal protein L29 n=1 Tax=Anaeramoeba flamelloides TaxID=1746091 RepID=A0AAV7ZFX3_9EUKA|nr:60S ribosomal protein L29 [Anaeramoeba flamelloides]
MKQKQKFLICNKIPKPNRDKSRSKKGLLKDEEISERQWKEWNTLSSEQKEELKKCLFLSNELRIECFLKFFPSEIMIIKNENEKISQIILNSKLLLLLSVGMKTGTSNLRSTLSSYFKKQGLIRNPNIPKFQKHSNLNLIDPNYLLSADYKPQTLNNFVDEKKRVKAKKNKVKKSKKVKLIFGSKTLLKNEISKKDKVQQVTKEENIIKHEPKGEHTLLSEDESQNNKKKNQNEKFHTYVIKKPKSPNRTKSRARKGKLIITLKHLQTINSLSLKERDVLSNLPKMKSIKERLKYLENHFQNTLLVIERDKNLKYQKIVFSAKLTIKIKTPRSNKFVPYNKKYIDNENFIVGSNFSQINNSTSTVAEKKKSKHQNIHLVPNTNTCVKISNEKFEKLNILANLSCQMI